MFIMKQKSINPNKENDNNKSFFHKPNYSKINTYHTNSDTFFSLAKLEIFKFNNTKESMLDRYIFR